ncbi:glycoside hydrolase family 13 protein [Talaromyces proteolyticus]|uniref:Glycoside hydrolase family 13 protein n=1 Tax=Talaromyces proteolyticus TaxID=1131652 RepID=A0AAD4KF92_9EURO|nr:glycoside hydrolase family 13 protein [Talaromyces proteolyticus]KAH8690615.1 glycoside hydrolase family 13 protein [Talaromyces proteolyticus]
MPPDILAEMTDAKHPLSSNRAEAKWWREAVVYQIYPRSFCDSNGDGIGDICGIISKIDYLKDLGVDVVWLSPIYASPQHDMGYDISDYRRIHPEYGTMEDWECLLNELHKAGIKLIMDLVVNHTSIDHPWFVQSRSSNDNVKRDWYHWQPPKYDAEGRRQPPNNWRSFFGKGSAWEWDENTQEYYLRVFTKEQPDLNWENPTMRAAVREVVTFWLDKGVDGFRIDAINYICKADGYPDSEIVDESSRFQPAMHLYMNVGNVHKYLRELHVATFSQYDVMTVGETPYVPATQLALDYVHPDRKEFDMIFQWEHMDIDRVPGSLLKWKPWKLPELKKIFNCWQRLMFENGGWNSLYMENHDQGRSISRFGSDRPEFRGVSGKLLAMMLGTLSGTLYIYQGQEIGMTNPTKWGLKDYPDIVTKTYILEEKEQRIRDTGETEPDMKDLLQDIRLKARDNGRTPIPWNSLQPSAGFTTGTPWMPLNPDFAVCNVDAAVKDTTSIFHFWKKLLSIRAGWKTLVYGSFELLSPEDPHIFAYRRTLPGSASALVVLNLSSQSVDWEFPLDLNHFGNIRGVFNNYPMPSTISNHFSMRPWECRLYTYDQI